MVRIGVYRTSLLPTPWTKDPFIHDPFASFEELRHHHGCWRSPSEVRFIFLYAVGSGIITLIHPPAIDLAIINLTNTQSKLPRCLLFYHDYL